MTKNMIIYKPYFIYKNLSCVVQQLNTVFVIYGHGLLLLNGDTCPSENINSPICNSLSQLLLNSLQG